MGRLSADRLMRKATAYLARHSASTGRLREVLARAIRREAGEDDPPGPGEVTALIDPVVERLQRAGLLDDAVFARGRTARLAAKGKPASAIAAELTYRFGVDTAEAGIAETLATLDPLAQATRWAERRRLGPYRLRDRAGKRDADIASLMRAGFSGRIARTVIDGVPGGEPDAHG